MHPPHGTNYWDWEYWLPQYWPDPYWAMDYAVEIPPRVYGGSGKWKKKPERPVETEQDLQLRLDHWREILEAENARRERERKDNRGFIEWLLNQVRDEMQCDIQHAKFATACILAQMLGIAEEMEVEDEAAMAVAMRLIEQ